MRQVATIDLPHKPSFHPRISFSLRNRYLPLVTDFHFSTAWPVHFSRQREHIRCLLLIFLTFIESPSTLETAISLFIRAFDTIPHYHEPLSRLHKAVNNWSSFNCYYSCELLIIQYSTESGVESRSLLLTFNIIGSSHFPNKFTRYYLRR